MRFELSHTHAYRGCRVRAEPAQPSDGEGEAMIEFSDGNVLIGRYTLNEGEVVLSIPAYRTARETSIASKRWSLQRIDKNEWSLRHPLGRYRCRPGVRGPGDRT